MKITTKVLTRSALILAIAIAIQSVRMPQFVTGPLVNTLLFLAVATTGSISGVLVGLFTPLLAFAFGIMPLAPAVPVIIAGNIVLALAFGYLRKNPYVGVGVAAIAKYAVMAIGVYYALPLLTGVNLPPKVLATLSTPQLFTAIGGGIIAIIILKAMPLFKKDKETKVQ
ncbi:MAG: ECF transporter S component [Firmicutes bacterium HGW-Firmicutes-12]|nr:MAG: ECF transporter S component [Firmicutes bacterium HGW-Firmicutes-12]